MLEGLQIPGELLPLLFLEEEFAMRGVGEVVLDVGADGGVDGLEFWLGRGLLGCLR